MRIKIQPILFRTIFLLGSVGVLSACGKKAASVEDSEPRPLASVNGVAVTEEAFMAEVQRRIDGGRHLGDADAILQDMIQRNIMLLEAEKTGVMNDPDSRREVENLILSQWLSQSLHIEKSKVTVSEDDLRAAYESNVSTYTRPALTRLAMLYRKTSKNTSKESIAALAAELEKARALFVHDREKALQGGRMKGFGSVAADYSEDAVTRYRGGDLGWLDESRDDYRWPMAVLETGFKLKMGEPSDIIHTDEGLYVVMKTDQRDAEITSYEEAAVTLRRRVLSEKQETVENHFMRHLMESNHVEIDQAKLSKLTLPDVEENRLVSEPPMLRSRGQLTPKNPAN